MREIKFRAWIEKHGLKEGHYPEVGNMFYWNEESGLGNSYGASRGFEHGTVMQFTGLHDKNGKSIYEGDIVIWKQALGGILQADPDPKTCIIEWDEVFSSWKCRDIKKGGHFHGYTFHECHMESVIGNIYENPDLL